MIYEVELLAFEEPGRVDIREVYLPEFNEERIKEVYIKSLHKDSLLGSIFYYGQNDFQPKEQRSVSVGDVIRLGHERWLVQGVGFHLLSFADYVEYLAMNRLTKMMFAFPSRRQGFSGQPALKG